MKNLRFGPWPRSPQDLQGVDFVVCLLTDDELNELAVERAEGVRIPIPDRHCPSNAETLRAQLEPVAERLRSGQQVYVHCRAGIGRAALVTGCLMLHLGSMEPVEIWAELERRRGVVVPDTDEQKRWLDLYAQHLRGARSLDEAFNRLLSS